MRGFVLGLWFLGSIPLGGQENLYPPQDFKIPSGSSAAQRHYQNRIAQFKQTPVKPGDLVFLGDSITEQAGDWGKKLNRTGVKNRGIGGDVSEGVLHRLDEISGAPASWVFLMIGINDLVRGISPQQVVDQILEIVHRLRTRAPDIHVVVQTILPVQSPGRYGPQIRWINDQLKKASKSQEFILLDLHPLYATALDQMDDQFSDDGLHLTPSGYGPWVTAVQELLARETSKK